MHSNEEQLNSIFQALSDSTRRSILLRIRDSDESVSDIAKQYDMSLPAITKHLNVLEKSGLIFRWRDGRRRLCRGKPKETSKAIEWLNRYQQFWDDNLESLKQFLENNDN